MALLNGLPVYSITFDEAPDKDSGIDFVSLVDYPAIESNWVALSKESQKAPLRFGFNADKQIIYGPILIPNKPIYRYDEKTGEEYFVVFTKDVVEKLVRKFQVQAKTINLNYQHLKDSQISQAVIQEIWLTGKPDKSNALGFDLEEGSGFVGAYIGDSKFWNEEIKSGNVRGFSIEGFLDMEMKKINIKKQMEGKFATAKTMDGVEVKTDAESFVVGSEVYTEVDGVKAPAPDGEHTLENGVKIKIEAGKITEVMEAEMSAEEVEIIQNAAKPLIEQMLKSQKDEYEARIKALEEKFANTPAAGSATEKTEKAEPAKLSQRKSLETKLSFLRKKDTEVTKK